MRRYRVARFVAPGRDLSDDDADAILASPQGQQIAQMMHYSAVGTPDRVKAYLDEFARIAGADELITAHASPTIEQRLRSVDLLADAVGSTRHLEPSAPLPSVSLTDPPADGQGAASRSTVFQLRAVPAATRGGG